MKIGMISFKVSHNLHRFYYSRTVDRLGFFFESLRTKGESLTFGAMGGISIFHAEQPHFGRIASIGNPDQMKVRIFLILFCSFVPRPLTISQKKRAACLAFFYQSRLFRKAPRINVDTSRRRRGFTLVDGNAL